MQTLTFQCCCFGVTHDLTLQPLTQPNKFIIPGVTLVESNFALSLGPGKEVGKHIA